MPWGLTGWRGQTWWGAISFIPGPGQSLEVLVGEGRSGRCSDPSWQNWTKQAHSPHSLEPSGQGPKARAAWNGTAREGPSASGESWEEGSQRGSIGRCGQGPCGGPGTGGDTAKFHCSVNFMSSSWVTLVEKQQAVVPGPGS